MAQAPFGVADLVLSGFLRIVTNPRIFARPTPLDDAIAACDALRSQPNVTVLAPGPRHWQIFTRLCTEAGARGNLVADAYLAALAIETGSEWITTDGDYRRFRGLRMRHPLDQA
jgi:toxin-antitoxin system PIN domain toxin